MLHDLSRGIPLYPLPEQVPRDDNVPHAPKRFISLNLEEQKLAIRNALRYFPEEFHELLGKEFADELHNYGHIYMYRFKPVNYNIKAYSIHQYPAKCLQAAAIMLMIMNNLDANVAQFPHELITYGGNGSVFSNWAQYHLTMKYLSEMTEEQTLVMYSGHPLGVFPSTRGAPRVVITNGMVVPNYSNRSDYDRMYALGVTQYGQMTAGSYCYIGPQGIVHGTTITLFNAARKYLGTSDLTGKVFVSSGLGGMSGAQPKAGTICKAIAIIAEINPKALNKRFNQGWIKEKEISLEKVVSRIKEARIKKESTSIGWLGNIVELWERLAKEPELIVDLGSDQTSLHNPYNGGYYPVTLSFEEANTMMIDNPKEFIKHVENSLKRQVHAINLLASKGMKFWDYGNSFLLEASRAKADVFHKNGKAFRYPSYVEDIMGDIFSLGFGPFRWVCTSCNHDDLMITDEIAKEVIYDLKKCANDQIRQQLDDNATWIENCEQHKLIVGSEARILYMNAEGRVACALRFNKAIANNRIKSPIVLSRDHHDVGGTDSPYRETANITDGSKFCADMSIHNVIGDSFLGATSVSLHNGGGTGWGQSINGGFLLVLDGSKEAEERAIRMLSWDVNHGITRRAWGGNNNALFQIQKAMEKDQKLKVTVPFIVSDAILENIFANSE